MVEQETLDKIREVLRQTYFGAEDDYVDVSSRGDEGVHVLVVSRKFQGKRLREKNDLIWSLLTENLPNEIWGQVTLSVGVTPDEVKAI